MKQKKHVYLFIFLFLTGVITRIFLLGSLPSGVNCDEAMGAVDAFALSTHGTDRFGTSWPVHFRAWGYSQMSVFLAYLQAICIHIFGFNTTAIRIPMAVLSILGMLAIYFLCKNFTSHRTALICLFLVVICPWHLIQSRWALDCNTFPHIFLVGLLLLLLALESTKWKRRCLLYGSMLLFGLTFYCYGIAVYSVPLFLAVFAAILCIQKKLQIKELLLCIFLFLAVAMGEILVMAINYLELNTIYTPLVTLERFHESIRSNDILFFDFSLEQLLLNCKSVLTVLFIQPPEAGWNNVAKYGNVYPVSGIFGVIGLICLIIKLRKEKDHFSTALLLYFFTALWIGITTRDVNVNRVNFIFYPWLILVAIGIDSIPTIVTGFFRKVPILKEKHRSLIPKLSTFAFGLVIVGYTILGIAFFRLYFLKYDLKYADSCFNNTYLKAMESIDKHAEYDVLYITSYNGYGARDINTEILMNYVAKHDALYLQGKSNISNGREFLPYKERYHFFYTWESNEKELATMELYNGHHTGFLIHENELEYIDNAYTIQEDLGIFKIIEYQTID